MHDHLPAPILDLAEHTPAARLWLGGGALAIAAAVGTVWAPLAGDIGLGVLGVLSLLGAGGLTWVKRGLGAMPLALAPVALRGKRDETQIFRFRGWLGRGRPMNSAVAEITYTDEAGHADFTVEAPVKTLIGPWTIVLPDPENACSGSGQFRVRLRALGQDPVEAVYASTVEGRFKPGFTTGPLRLQPGDFGRVEST